jgi:hypothetical protein
MRAKDQSVKWPKVLDLEVIAPLVKKRVSVMAQKMTEGTVREKSKHIKLAYGVVRDGIPFFSNGVYGMKKGAVTVQLGSGKVQLVCGNLMPVDLDATGVPEEDEALRHVEQTIHEVQNKWFRTQ